MTNPTPTPTPSPVDGVDTEAIRADLAAFDAAFNSGDTLMADSIRKKWVGDVGYAAVKVVESVPALLTEVKRLRGVVAAQQQQIEELTESRGTERLVHRMQEQRLREDSGKAPRWDEDRVAIQNGWIEGRCGGCGEALPNRDMRVEQLEQQIEAVVDLAGCGFTDDEHPCCAACDGTGFDHDGICHDCRGTKHLHGPCDDEAFAQAVLRAALALSPGAAADEESVPFSDPLSVFKYGSEVTDEESTNG